MKTSKLRLKIVSFLAVACMLCVGLASFIKTDDTVLAEGAEIQISTLQDSYMAGTEITAPQTVEIVYNGQTYTSTGFVIRYPDGSVYNKAINTLTDVGVYTLIYSFVVDGKTLCAEKEISVEEYLYSVSNKNSSVTYGDLTMKKSPFTEGLIVELAGEAAFTYNQPIDISKMDLVNVCTYMPYWRGKTAPLNDPITPDETAADYLIIRLEDVHNPDVYLEFWQDYHNPGASGYFTAVSNNGFRAGIQWNSTASPQVSLPNGAIDMTTGKVIEDYPSGRLHTEMNSENGSSCLTSSPISNYGIGWTYNQENQIARMQYNGLRDVLVNDFDAPEIYKEEEQRFQGFTTGEVYFSMRLVNPVTEKARIQIAQICGMSGEQLKQGICTDTSGPKINIDADLINDSVYALKGEAFQVFSASQLDPNKTGKVEAAVYYNYGSESQTSISLKDGVFTPKKVGQYTIVYKATDKYGNVAEKVVYVNVLDRWKNETMDQRIVLKNMDSLEGTAYCAGAEAALPNYEVLAMNEEMFGIKIEAIAPSGEVSEVNLQANCFFPTEVGEYTLRYTYWDNVGTFVDEYKVLTTVSENTNFLGAVQFPRYFIKNASYDIPTYDVATYVSAGKPVVIPISAKASFDGGDFVEIPNDKLLVSGSETVQLKYEYADSLFLTEKIKIVNVDYGNKALKIGEYFQGDFTYDSKKLTYASNKLSGENTLSFINNISLDTFALKFKIPEGALYSGVRITLTDYYNRENKAVVELVSDGDKAGFNYQGLTLWSNVSFANGKEKTVVYNPKNNSFTFDDISYVNKTAFTSDLVLLDVTLFNLNAPQGATSEVSIALTSVGNQTISSLGRDVGKPIITVSSEASGRWKLGDVVTLYVGTISDIYCPVQSSDIRLSVKTSSGFVRAMDGTLLDGTQNALVEYQLELNEYGSYLVVYEARDAYNNLATYSFNIVLENAVAPTASFKDGTTESTIVYVELGKQYKLKEIVYGDDKTPVELISVTYFIIDMNTYGMVEKKDEVCFTWKGLFKVHYYIMDENGNTTTLSYYVQVE